MQVSNVHNLLHAQATTDHPRKGQPASMDILTLIRRYSAISPQMVRRCSMGNIHLVADLYCTCSHGRQGSGVSESS